jgi:CheY-like chemotaxis protein
MNRESYRSPVIQKFYTEVQEPLEFINTMYERFINNNIDSKELQNIYTCNQILKKNIENIINTNNHQSISGKALTECDSIHHEIKQNLNRLLLSDTFAQPYNSDKPKFIALQDTHLCTKFFQEAIHNTSKYEHLFHTQFNPEQRNYMLSLFLEDLQNNLNQKIQQYTAEHNTNIYFSFLVNKNNPIHLSINPNLLQKGIEKMFEELLKKREKIKTNKINHISLNITYEHHHTHPTLQCTFMYDHNYIQNEDIQNKDSYKDIIKTEENVTISDNKYIEALGSTVSIYQTKDAQTLFHTNIPYPINLAIEPENYKLRTKNTKILIADDHNVSRTLTPYLLKREGYEESNITIAENGQEVLNIIKEHPKKFNILLLNGIMPPVNGMEATKIIREEYNNHTPIIGFSATEDLLNTFIEMGANDTYSSPTTISLLRRKLQKYL